MKRIIYLVCLFFISLSVIAQGENNQDIMNRNGKIYVVIAVMLTILAGLVLYLIRLDRRLSKLENND